MLPPTACVFIPSAPKAAATRSEGTVKRDGRMLSVPVSSVLRALTRSAGSQSICVNLFPTYIYTEKVSRHTIVLHSVQTTLGENSHLHRRQFRLNSPNTVLAHHVRGRVARDGSNQVGGPRMQVRWQHAAASELQERDGHAMRSDGGEAGSVGNEHGTSGAVEVGVKVEVVDPVIVVWEQSLTIKVCGSGLELGIESGVNGARFGVRGHEEGQDGGEEDDWGVHDDGSGWYMEGVRRRGSEG
jgi:hypothetical protein